ncbi:MAG TPA: error-prone DNA polymerase, partial [Candidatus Melainabacteria bacterium]|nr:error-prone DNA polymerase [Candidatus Melainabacteria bacterium]
SQEAIDTITHQLRAFANYGFPESHAASFSLLVYASAYLKRYFAPEFYCAILNAQPMGFYSPGTLIRDALRHGVEVRPVDLSCSSWNCVLEAVVEEDDDRDSFEAEGLQGDQFNNIDSISPGAGDFPKRTGQAQRPGERKPPALRIGLRYVDGLGRAARESLEAAWQEGGPFSSLEDVIERSGLAPSELKILDQAGAFDGLYPGRRKALWKVLDKLRKKVETP